MPTGTGCAGVAGPVVAAVPQFGGVAEEVVRLVDSGWLTIDVSIAAVVRDAGSGVLVPTRPLSRLPQAATASVSTSQRVGVVAAGRRPHLRVAIMVANIHHGMAHSS